MRCCICKPASQSPPSRSDTFHAPRKKNICRNAPTGDKRSPKAAIGRSAARLTSGLADTEFVALIDQRSIRDYAAFSIGSRFRRSSSLSLFGIRRQRSVIAAEANSFRRDYLGSAKASRSRSPLAPFPALFPPLRKSSEQSGNVRTAGTATTLFDDADARLDYLKSKV